MLKVKLFLVVLIISVFACDNSINSKDGELITHTLCKNEKNLAFDTNESCVEYSYDAESKTLSVKHINTAFNCCPDALYAEVTIEGNTITIEEIERKQECNCMCLYDIEVEVYNIEIQPYTLKFKEPYIGEQYELSFGINLNEETSGTYCVERTNYPWDVL